MPESPLHVFLLLPLGILVGAYGTLIGAGGGFLLIPALLFLYPDQTPKELTSISLAVVFFNAFSGTVAYGHMRRIDFRSGVWFALASVPGAIGGTLVAGVFPRETFNGVFGGLLIALSAFIVAKPRSGEHHIDHLPGDVIRTMVEADGKIDRYEFNMPIGMLTSGAIGFVSSVMGIGGGAIQVPTLVRFFNFPSHIATATSQFVLVVMSFVAVLSHMARGAYIDGDWFRRTLLLAMGVMIGAQVGALFSRRLKAENVIRLLALALVGVGGRLLWGAVR